jgi:hypothetical protein
MEEFMKKKAEQDRHAIKELMKEMAEKNQFYYLSHFKKNHHGNFKKTNEIITFDTPPTEVPPNVTANDFSTMVDTLCLSMMKVCKHGRQESR